MGRIAYVMPLFGIVLSGEGCGTQLTGVDSPVYLPNGRYEFRVLEPSIVMAVEIREGQVTSFVDGGVEKAVTGSAPVELRGSTVNLLRFSGFMKPLPTRGSAEQWAITFTDGKSDSGAYHGRLGFRLVSETKEYAGYSAELVWTPG